MDARSQTENTACRRPGDCGGATKSRPASGQRFGLFVIYSCLSLIYSGAACVAVPTSPSSPKETAGSPSSAANKPNGWIQEVDDRTWGKLVCRTSKQGTFFYNERGGYSVVCEQSTGSVVLENPGRKLYFRCSDGQAVKNRIGFFLYRQASMPFSLPKKWERFSTTTYFGHPVIIYRGANSVHSPLEARKNFDGLEFWVAQDIPIPSQAAAFNHQIHGWPLIDLLPLRAIKMEPAKQRVLFNTTSLKPTFIPANTFQLPKNYKETKEEMEVTTNDNGNLQGLIENWGAGEKPK